MKTQRSRLGRSLAYEQAFAANRQLLDFLADFGIRRGWKSSAKLLAIRLETTLQRFLDAPTEAHLAQLLAIQEDARQADRRLPGVFPGYRIGT